MKVDEPKKKKSVHWPGIGPGSPAWQARILPLNHQCLHRSENPLILLSKEMQNKKSPQSCLAAPALSAGGHLVCALVFL